MQEHINNYIEWLKQKITFTQIGEWYEITTPFVNNHNDLIQIYAKNDKDNITLTDGGYTLNELELHGIEIEASKKTRNDLYVILNRFGVKYNNGILSVVANNKTFPDVMHRFIQAILSVNDMVQLADHISGII